MNGDCAPQTLEEQIAALQLALAARDATIAAQNAIISQHKAEAVCTQPASQGGQERDCSILVECRKPYRVHQAEAKWLQFFGFRSAEVEGRSIRLCFGPETDADAIHNLLDQAAQAPSCREAEGVWTRIALYDKSGDVHHMLLRAGYEHAETGQCCLDLADAPVPRARLFLRLGGCGPSPGVSKSEVPTLKLSCNETSPLLGHNQAFLDMYAIPSADMLNARGVALIFGPATDGRRWKSLIRQASNGAIKTCSLTTYTTAGDEVVVTVTMRPDESAGFLVADHKRPLQLVASFEVNAGDSNNPSEPAESSWLSSTSSTSSNTSTGSTTSRGSVVSSPNTSEFDDSAFKIHLKAMRIHKQKVMANRQRDDLDVESALQRERLMALTHLSKHAQTWSPGQATQQLNDSLSNRETSE